jgi:lipopolysaccharide/colanic/teichoic acid biosynthesis glycosyltransferase
MEQMRTDTILVVDDDPDTCQLLSMMLDDGRVHVDTAFDGFQGVEKAKLLDPSLIVLDVMMPEMDGWETYSQLKTWSDVPILFLSAKCDLVSVAYGLDLGADGYLCKPFSMVELKTRILELLDLPVVDEPFEDQPQAYIEPKTKPGVKKYIEPATRPSIDPRPPSVSYRVFKRLLDIFISATTLFFLTPILAICGLLVRLETRGPALYKQKRVGLKKGDDGNAEEVELGEFELLKLRTMRCDADAKVHREFVQAFIARNESKMNSIQGDNSSARKLTRDTRVTKVGRFLRRSSLDEFPQLFNVIKGDMSLVGPRPALSYETDVYEDWHRKRLMVKPGVTGLWQVTSRSSAEFDEMVRMDIWYIENRSLLLDLKILLKTPLAILSTKGAA